MSEEKGALRKLFWWQKVAKTIADVSSGSIHEAQGGYYLCLHLMIHQFKEAAAKRKLVNGVNTNLESVSMFRQQAVDHLSEGLWSNVGIYSVACICNAAECCFANNGNIPFRSNNMLFMALNSMHSIARESQGACSDNWWAVYEHLCLLMRLNGCLEFNSEEWVKALDSMNRNSAMLGLSVRTTLEELKRRDTRDALAAKRLKAQTPK